MNTPKISVIVPVYNVEQYLSHCIDTILAQTFTDFELLLIDDGSTDSSYSICKKYESKDKRVKVYKKTNGGVSSARNHGIENAKGIWITFIDSDDYIGHNYLFNLLSSINDKDSYDIVLLKGLVKYDNITNFFTKAPLCISAEQLIESLCKENSLFLSCWGKLFKKEIIYNNNIRFTNNLSFCEDIIFCFEYFKYIKNKILICNELLYYYRDVETSLTHKNVNYGQVLIASELLYNEFIIYQSKFHNNHVIIKHFITLLVDCVLRIGEQIFYDKTCSKDKRNNIIKSCKKYSKNVSYKYLLNFRVKSIIKFYVIKYLPSCLIKIMYLIK